jgi:hypothetical protein
MSKIIQLFPYLVAREKAKRGKPDQENTATPLVTLFARQLLLNLAELPTDMTIAWALGYNSVSNIHAMEMWIGRQCVKLSHASDPQQQLDQLKKMLRATLNHAANDGVYEPPFFVPSIFKE